MVFASYQTWLSLDSGKGMDDHDLSLHAIRLDCLWMTKRVQMIMICLCVPSDLIVSGWRKGCEWPWFVSMCHRTWSSLDDEMGEDDHDLSLRAIRLNRLWMTKRVRMTMICLRMPSNLIVSRWWKGCGWPYWSLRIIGLAVSGRRRQTKVVSVDRHRVFNKGSGWPYWSLHVIELAVSGWRRETKVVSVFFH